MIRPGNLFASLINKVKFGLGLSIALLIIAAILSIVSIKNLVEFNRWVNHTNIVIGKLEGILSELKNTETGQRGYQITQDSIFLEPYYRSRRDVFILYDQLRTLTSTIPQQQERLELLKPLAEKKFQFIDTIIFLVSVGDLSAAKSITASKEPKRYMDRIKLIIKDMIEEEEGLLKQREEKANQATIITFLIVGITLVIAIGMAVLFFIRIVNDIAKSEMAEKELWVLNRKLEDTIEELASRENQLSELNQELEERVEERAKAIEYEIRVNKTISDNATSGLLMMDAKGYCTFINPAGERMLGFSLDEIKQKPLHYMIHHHRPDGSFYPVEECPIDRALPENSDIRAHEDVFIRKDGTFFPVSCAASPIFENGVPVSTIVEVRDITEDKKSQKEIFERNRELSESNKELIKINEDLDNFIYTASHDLKAPISNIEGLVNAFKGGIISSDTNKEEQLYFLELIQISIARFKETILGLTEISKVQKIMADDVQEIDTLQVLTEVIDSIAHTVKSSKAAIKVNVADCKKINFSRKNFKSILYNLIGNAIKYKAPGRDPIIEISCMKTNELTLYEVKDNGLGIPQDKHDFIFGMFKRMHSHVEGTGVGLYIVKRLIENAGGKIEVESEVGRGSTFKIYLRN